MKAELKLKPHDKFPDQNIIEVWYDGKFIAAVYGADGPGVRVISKYPMTAGMVDTLPATIGGIEIIVIPAEWKDLLEIASSD